MDTVSDPVIAAQGPTRGILGSETLPDRSVLNSALEDITRAAGAREYIQAHST